MKYTSVVPSLIAAVFTTLSCLLPANAAPNLGSWDVRFVGSGIDGEVLALASEDSGALLVGGRFGGSVGSPKGVTRFQDGRWSALGAPPADGVGDGVFCALTLAPTPTSAANSEPTVLAYS